MLKVFTVVALMASGTLVFAQDDQAIIREFTPKRSELENTFDRTFYWNRVVSIHGYLKFSKDRFRFRRYQSIHVPHGKPSKSKLNTIRGSIVIKEHFIHLEYDVNKTDTAKLHRDRPDTLYLIRGIEMSTKSDLERNRAYKIIFLIPADKEEVGTKMIADFLNEMRQKAADLREFDYWDLYLKGVHQLRETKFAEGYDIGAFSRQYFNEP